MKSILYILSAIIFYCSTVYAGNFEQVCMDIGYDEDSEKFHACVEKLTARDKPINKNSKLAKKAGVKPEAVAAIAIQLGLATIKSSNLENESTKPAVKAPVNNTQSKNICSPMSVTCLIAIGRVNPNTGALNY